MIVSSLLFECMAFSELFWEWIGNVDLTALSQNMDGYGEYM